MKLNINPKIKNILWGVFAVVMVIVLVVCIFMNPGPEHIEDTNGAQNFALQTITEQDVVEQKMGSRGTVSEKKSSFNFAGIGVSDGTKYSSKKFTGVSSIYTTTIFKGSDIYINLSEYIIEEGNFAFYVVFDGEVVGKVEPTDNGISEFLLENVDKTGALEYVIAGESASFKFIAPTEFE